MRHYLLESAHDCLVDVPPLKHVIFNCWADPGNQQITAIISFLIDVGLLIIYDLRLLHAYVYHLQQNLNN